MSPFFHQNFSADSFYSSSHSTWFLLLSEEPRRLTSIDLPMLDFRVVFLTQWTTETPHATLKVYISDLCVFIFVHIYVNIMHLCYMSLTNMLLFLFTARFELLFPFLILPLNINSAYALEDSMIYAYTLAAGRWIHFSSCEHNSISRQ